MSTMDVPPLKIECRHCHANPGQQCRWSSGEERPYHLTRTEDAAFPKRTMLQRFAQWMKEICCGFTMHGHEDDFYSNYGTRICLWCGKKMK